MRKFLVLGSTLIVLSGSVSGCSTPRAPANSTPRDLASAAQTKNSCDAYLGRTVVPQDFDSAIAGLAGLTPKGEFETTAQYQVRRAASLRGVGEVLIVEKEPEGREYFEYDADAGLLRIKSYAFDNQNLSFWDAFYSAGFYARDVASSSNFDVVISSTDVPRDSYMASNAFGATIEVTTLDRTTRAIFDRPSNNTTTSLFPAAETAPYAVGELRVPTSDARRLKEELRIAFVVSPKEPFLVAGQRKVGETTIRNPRAVTENFTILVADIRCGLVMDRAGTVLGAYPTN